MVELMPPFVLLGIVGAAAFYGFQQFKKDANRVIERRRRQDAEQRTHAHGTLVRGADGVYRIENTVARPWVLGYKKHVNLEHAWKYLDVDLSRRKQAK